jgi:DNA-binding transcriptional LysR family regulator
VQLQHLEAFAAVARDGTITRAAETLFVSQPALTARIQGLERAVQAELFTRGRHGSRLTEAGRAFLPHSPSGR